MDLTTWARYKTYFGITADTTQAMVQQLISRASDHAVRWLGRGFSRQVYTDQRLNGTGTRRIMLPDTPIISVASVSVGGVDVPVSADAISLGYQFDSEMLYAFGFSFTRGLRNVMVSWTAGFTSSQTAFIPIAPGPYTITPTNAPDSGSSFAAVDRGVVFTNTGAALTNVAGAPATGQYAFNAGVYTFASADAGLSVTMSYDYIPGGVEQAVLELAGLKVKQRDNLGITSKTLAGESITYESKDMTPSIERLLWPYRKVTPV